jgi:hypothetical protein
LTRNYHLRWPIGCAQNMVLRQKWSVAVALLEEGEPLVEIGTAGC